MIGERLMLCRVRLMAHESSNCVGFQRGTPSHQGQTTEDDSSHDYRTLSQPTGSAVSPCNACAGGSVAGCCNDTSTACAGSSGCPHFGQFMRKVSYGAHRWRLAASRNFTTGVTMAAAFCERSLSNNERRHRPAEVLRTASNRQIEITVTTQRVPVTVFTRQRDRSDPRAGSTAALPGRVGALPPRDEREQPANNLSGRANQPIVSIPRLW